MHAGLYILWEGGFSEFIRDFGGDVFQIKEALFLIVLESHIRYAAVHDAFEDVLTALIALRQFRFA